MAKRYAAFWFIIALCLIVTDLIAQQPQDGENSYRLSAVHRRFLPEPDTIDCEAGRSVMVAAEPDLDNDGKPEILVTEYSDGGRILVFEVAGNDRLEYVWGSKRLTPGVEGPSSTPRMVSVGDFDNNGMMEIHFHVGYAVTDTLRGHYIYEYTGNDNDFGTDPVRVLAYQEVDPLLAGQNCGRLENPLTIEDVDGDGRAEMLWASRATGILETGNLYILEVENGTFAGGDATIRLEYKYTGMAKAIDFGDDGYMPVATAVGDIDNDGLKEIVVLGWTNINPGGGVGFLEVSGFDSYTPGSVVQLSESSIFTVKGSVSIVDANGEKAVIIAGMDTGSFDKKVWVADNIASEAFISESNFSVILDGIVSWGIMAIGDQDHGSGSDGFDLYVSRTNEIWDYEYNGTGALSDPASYTNHGRLGQFNLDEVYDVSDGLFNSLYTYPGMDLDQDGNQEIVASYKGACGAAGDVLEGQPFRTNTFNVFVFEWGDSTQSIPINLSTKVDDRRNNWTIITPDDYVLEQNYPNPFNPSTNLNFTLPLDKRVSLRIYDALGNEVRTLIDNAAFSQGSHTVQWDATNNNGEPVASGVYVYKLIYGNFSKSKTMTLVR